ncbi:MAG: DUF58 domain-containing protein [Xanthomonadales bacterium]|nr:DUF58 domain-containing protein [Xanthomonadales bacterium]
MTATLRARLARWLPTPPTGPLPLALPRRRIYILPSRFGLVYGAALFFLLIGALNYNNNAAILLALMLGATAMASAVSAVNFLSGLKVLSFEAGEAWAGQDQACRLEVGHPGGRVRGALQLRHADRRSSDQPAGASSVAFAWHWPATHRGQRRLGRIRLATGYPLGLFTAWCVLDVDAVAVVYPAPESPAPALPASAADAGGRARPSRGEDDWHALREFQRGDSPRDVAWKVSARHDRLLVAETRSEREAPVLRLSTAQVAGLAREHGIARLAAWVLQAHAQDRPYALDLPGQSLPPGSGLAQRRLALTALALLP